MTTSVLIVSVSGIISWLWRQVTGVQYSKVLEYEIKTSGCALVLLVDFLMYQSSLLLLVKTEVLFLSAVRKTPVVRRNVAALNMMDVGRFFSPVFIVCFLPRWFVKGTENRKGKPWNCNALTNFVAVYNMCRGGVFFQWLLCWKYIVSTDWTLCLCRGTGNTFAFFTCGKTVRWT